MTALRAIEPSTAPKLQDVEVSKLKVDPTYQRKPNPDRINKMAREWDDHLCEPLVVSFRDGDLFVVIGQHRMLAARKAGIRTVPCLIFYGLAREDDARIFEANASSTKPISWRDRHHSLMTMRSPIALEVDRIIRAHGHAGFVPKSSNGKIGAVSRCYALAKAGVLDRVLSIIDSAWQQPDGSWLNQSHDNATLKALADFLERYPQVDDAGLARACGRNNPGTVKMARGGGNAVGSWRIIREWYNRGRNSGRLGSD